MNPVVPLEEDDGSRTCNEFFSTRSVQLKHSMDDGSLIASPKHQQHPPTPTTNASKNLRGLNKPKCIKSGKVARSRHSFGVARLQQLSKQFWPIQ
ncbi:hypothetical protein F0562_012576 [Nyssa sinensis]|uniref:Uncharacterized protein n=1 Tax=Nyssa sinensis TaxID=561372 RepID=A0A5J4ZUU0_9ASTE|nr:hypothetical protein F0562_012576 [Nyssa sinensis]